MPSSVQSSNITGLTPVYSSDDDRELLYQFRSIERTGYLNVSDLTRDLLYDASTQGALSVVNVVITETHLSSASVRAGNIAKFTQYTTSNASDPDFMAQRIRSLSSGGKGYNVGDTLINYVNHARSNVMIRVTAVDPTNDNAISRFEVLDSGEYSSATNPRGTGKPLSFRKRSAKGIFVQGLDYSFEQDTTPVGLAPAGFPITYPKGPHTLTFQSRHFGNGWISGQALPGPTLVPRATVIVYATTGGITLPAGVAPVWSPTDNRGVANYDPNIWINSFGLAGGGGPANPFSLNVYTFTGANVSTAAGNPPVGGGEQTRWPIDGIWVNVPSLTNTVLFEGQEIFLKPGSANGQSFIPPGTTITKLDDIEVVNGINYVRRPGAPGGWNVYETTTKYIYMLLSANVRIDKGDQFYVKGSGGTIDDTSLTNNSAEIFQVVTESRSRIDPLAVDRQQVSANVIAYSGNNVRLGNIRHGWTAWAPTIFEGALITHQSIDTNSARVANIANIQYSKIAGSTTANIVTDVPLPAGIGTSQLFFTLTTDQPYRIMFSANGLQTLNIAAGTSVQMRNDANIAIPRIADYTGGINDIVGLMGDVPSLPTLSTVASDRAVGMTATLNGTLLTITGGVGTQKIYAGYCIDITVGPAGLLQNTIIINQVLPLIAGEAFNGLGRYVVSKNYSNPVAFPANLALAKVLDRNLDPQDVTQGFINRSIRVAQYPQAYPLSYMVTFAKQGMFLATWEGTWSIMQKSRQKQLDEKDAWFSWFLIQRPVNRKNGFVRTAGQSPVFCINSVGYKYWKFIVRERDVMHPTQGDSATTAQYYNDITGLIETRSTPYRVPADAHTEDSHAVLNTTHQIALTEDSKYLVSFLYNLTTPRFRYSDELDLIGQTAADVSMASSDVKITAYGEPTARVYKALSANLPYNAGLRICVLKDIYTS